MPNVGVTEQKDHRSGVETKKDNNHAQQEKGDLLVERSRGYQASVAAIDDHETQIESKEDTEQQKGWSGGGLRRISSH